MEDFTVEYATEPRFGMQLPGGPFVLKVHERAKCEGGYCGIHNPSDHPLKDAPRNWRSDKAEMERMCPHGIGHPDKDGLNFSIQMATLNGQNTSYLGVHGCDGCCA